MHMIWRAASSSANAARQRRATEDDERVELLGDALRRRRARRRRRAAPPVPSKVMQVDRAAVHLVVRLVVADDVLHRLELLLVRVVDGDGIGDVGDDRVALLALVVDDGDLVGRDARAPSRRRCHPRTARSTPGRRSRGRRGARSRCRTARPSRSGRRCPAPRPRVKRQRERDLGRRRRGRRPGGVVSASPVASVRRSAVVRRRSTGPTAVAVDPARSVSARSSRRRSSLASTSTPSSSPVDTDVVVVTTWRG